MRLTCREQERKDGGYADRTDSHATQQPRQPVFPNQSERGKACVKPMLGADCLPMTFANLLRDGEVMSIECSE